MAQRAPQAAAALAALLLGGCSGTPFGDQLSRSFSAPQPTPSTGTAAAAKGPTPAAPKPAATATATAPTAAALPPAEPARAIQAMPPAPYRITIQLPAADPSAPAEAVTEALRKAGVPFEVEMIERVSSSGAASGAAAPAPLATPRPAPAPRPR